MSNIEFLGISGRLDCLNQVVKHIFISFFIGKVVLHHLNRPEMPTVIGVQVSHITDFKFIIAELYIQSVHVEEPPFRVQAQAPRLSQRPTSSTSSASTTVKPTSTSTTSTTVKSTSTTSSLQLQRLQVVGTAVEWQHGRVPLHMLAVLRLYISKPLFISGILQHAS